MSMKDYFDAVREDEENKRRASMQRELHKKICYSKRLLPKGRLKHVEKQIERMQRILNAKAA
jgi:hypothetical protein